MRHLVALLVFAASAYGQVHLFSREQLVQYTAKNPYGQFEDGRPKVPDVILEKCKGLTVEEIWGVLNNSPYKFQYESNFQQLHPGIKLIGRAVTAQFMPARPDVAEVQDAAAQTRGQTKNNNQRVIDLLQTGDVLVVDLFGKIDGGTFVGDNLAAAVRSATGNGFVVDGAIRDLEGIHPMDMNIFFRGVHPSAIREVMLTSLNTPVRIGNATVMPGDVVFGDRTGVYFIPPQLIEQILTRAEETHIHDEWTKEKFKTGRYKSSELYPTPKSEELKKEYEAYKKKKLAGN